MTRVQTLRRRRWPTVAVTLGLTVLFVLGLVLILGDPWPSAGDPSADDATESQSPSVPTGAPSTTPDPTDPTDPGTGDPTDPGTVSPDPASPSDPAGQPSAPPSSAPSPAPTVTTTGPIGEDGAEAIVAGYLSTVSELEADTVDVPALVGNVAGAPLVAEIEADLLELDSQGWQRTGTPVVASMSVLEQDEDASPPTATVQACIDSSDVQVLDSSGEPLPQDPSTARALNIYQLTQNEDGSWFIASRSFPSDPAC